MCAHTRGVQTLTTENSKLLSFPDYLFYFRLPFNLGKNLKSEPWLFISLGEVTEPSLAHWGLPDLVTDLFQDIIHNEKQWLLILSSQVSGQSPECVKIGS